MQRSKLTCPRSPVPLLSRTRTIAQVFSSSRERGAMLREDHACWSADAGRQSDGIDDGSGNSGVSCVGNCGVMRLLVVRWS